MAAKKIDIMDVRQLIQLKSKGESNRSCSSILGIHRNTVNYYVRQLNATGIPYSELQLLTDSGLKELFPSRTLSDSDRYEELAQCFSYFKQQLLLPGATREALWKEYLQNQPEGYGYTQFNEHLNTWLGHTKASGKFTHKAGDKLLVDININPVFSRSLPIAIFKLREIGNRRTVTGEKRGIKVIIRTGGIRNKAQRRRQNISVAVSTAQ